MNGVPSICIDPHLLSLPQTGRSTAEDVEDFVSAIVDWAKTADGKCTTAFVCRDVIDAIDQDGAFPWKIDLLRILRHFRVHSADHETVASAIQSLLNSVHIDTVVGVNSLLLDSSKTGMVPAFIYERLRPYTKVAFCDQLAMVVLAQVSTVVENIALGSIPNGNEDPALSYLSFTAEIADIEWCSGSDESVVSFPHAIDEKISVFYSRTGFLEMIEPISLWPDSDDAVQACNAIDCCIARIVASGTSGTERLAYEIGSEFIHSAAQWECGQNGRHNFTLIESCARLVLGIEKHRVSEFVDNDTQRQKLRADGALACRTHLTKKGAGLRLMFWKLPDGSIEFANVGNKDELVIR